MELISREQLRKGLGDITYYPNVEEILNLINSLPTFESRPKGKWIDTSTPWTEIQCSNCDEIYGMEFIISTHAIRNYCPNCGAEMRGEE